MKKTIGTLIIALIAGIGVLFVWPVFSYSRPSWPLLTESDKNEILGIINDWKSKGLVGEIGRADWPNFIVVLRPQGVHFDGSQISITLSGGGIGPGWGFYVTQTGRPDPDGMILIDSEDPRFQKFKQRE